MNWAQAFARQAQSDLDARDTLLANTSLPTCHSLHYLQMACEKTCKAAMIKGGTAASQVQRSHAHIAKQLPIIVREYLSRRAGQIERDSWIVDAVRPLARKIELLNPAVQGGGGVPQNCEYPWSTSTGAIVAPADHKFDFSMLFEPAGVTLLKILRQAAADLQQ